MTKEEFEHLDKLFHGSPSDFEEFARELFRYAGFPDAQSRERSDMQIDVVVPIEGHPDYDFWRQFGTHIMGECRKRQERIPSHFIARCAGLAFPKMMDVRLRFLFDPQGVTGKGIRQAGERLLDILCHKELQFVVFDTVMWEACREAKTTLSSFIRALVEECRFEPLIDNVNRIIETARKLDAWKPRRKISVDLHGNDLLSEIQKLKREDFEPTPTERPIQRFETSYGDYATAISLLGRHAHLIQAISCAAPYEWWALPGRHSRTQEGLQLYADKVDDWKRQGKLIMRITAIHNVDDLDNVWSRVLTRFGSNDDMIRRWCNSLGEHMLNNPGEYRQRLRLEKILEKLQDCRAHNSRDPKTEKNLTRMILRKYIEGLHHPQDTAVYVAPKQGLPESKLPSYLCEQLIYNQTWYIKLDQSEIIDNVTGEFGPLSLRAGLTQTWLYEFRLSYFAEKKIRERGQLKKFLKGVLKKN